MRPRVRGPLTRPQLVDRVINAVVRDYPELAGTLGEAGVDVAIHGGAAISDVLSGEALEDLLAKLVEATLWRSDAEVRGAAPPLSDG